MQQVRHLFWDFDGTLYDSYPQMLKAFRLGLDDLNISHLADDRELLRLMKNTCHYAAVRIAEMAGLDVKAVEEAFRFHHEQVSLFPPYQGLAECMQALHDAGYRHYLYTHRDHTSVDQLQQDGLWHLFDDAVTSEQHFPYKPAPDALLYLIQKNQLVPSQCAMIGDRTIDIDAGHNAGMKGILFDPEEFFWNYPCAMRVKSMNELQQKLLSLHN